MAASVSPTPQIGLNIKRKVKKSPIVRLDEGRRTQMLIQNKENFGDTSSSNEKISIFKKNKLPKFER